MSAPSPIAALLDARAGSGPGPAPEPEARAADPPDADGARRPARSGPTTTTGIFREIRYLATGLSTDRVPEDDIVVATVHFTKDNGELSSITLDEQSKVELVNG